MAQMKEQIRTLEKELSNEERANLLDAEFTTPVIRILTEMTEHVNKIKEEMKAMQNEIKKYIYTGNQQWREGSWDSNQHLEQKEEENIQPENFPNLTKELDMPV